MIKGSQRRDEEGIIADVACGCGEPRITTTLYRPYNVMSFGIDANTAPVMVEMRLFVKVLVE